LEFRDCSVFDFDVEFIGIDEVQILTERWRREYNTIRLHSSLGYRPPVPEAFMSRLQLAANPR
jgi:transposase InsO family protein